jgi:polyisoprenyl-phosphate glycosyltransferase
MTLSAAPTHARRLVVLMPLRDDWASAAELVRRIDRALSAQPCAAHVLLVDDGSIEPVRPADFQGPFAAVTGIRVLHLRRNLGHQRSIAIGLVHADRAFTADAVVVMDADGEDTAEGVVQLIAAYSGEKAVFAERSRRTESLVFRLFYRLYKSVHLLLTGVRVRVGNFSILPFRYLGALIVMPELWNHYAAAVFRSGLPFATTPIARGHRISGTSRMNFVTLTRHGLSAMSVFADVIGVRLILAVMAGSALTVLGILAVVGIRVFTTSAIPGWATFSIIGLVIILIQLMTIATSFTFTMLAHRATLEFVPLRDHEVFVAGVQDLIAHE